jgi:hypothetical protein
VSEFGPEYDSDREMTPRHEMHFLVIHGFIFTANVLANEEIIG